MSFQGYPPILKSDSSSTSPSQDSWRREAEQASRDLVRPASSSSSSSVLERSDEPPEIQNQNVYVCLCVLEGSISPESFLFAPLRGHIPCLAVSVSVCLCALVFVCVNACVCRCLCVCLVVCVFVCGGVDTLSTPSSLFCLTPPPQTLSPFFSTHNAPAHFVRAPVFTTIPYMFQHLDMKCSFSNGFRHCCPGTLVFTKFLVTHTTKNAKVPSDFEFAPQAPLDAKLVAVS